MRTVETVYGSMFNMDTIKVLSINAIAFLSTLTSIDAVLKLILLLVSIIFTVVRILAIIKKDLIEIKGGVDTELKKTEEIRDEIIEEKK